MSKNVLLKGLTAGVVAFFLGWLIYGVLLKGCMEGECSEAMKGMMRAESDMIWWALIASNLLFGYMIALYGTAQGASGWMDWAKKSALIGAVYSLAYGLSGYAMMDMMSLQGFLTDAAITAVMAACMGAAASFVGNEE